MSFHSSSLISPRLFSEKQVMQDKIRAAVVNLSFILQPVHSVLSVYCPRILSIILVTGGRYLNNVICYNHVF